LIFISDPTASGLPIERGASTFIERGQQAARARPSVGVEGEDGGIRLVCGTLWIL